MIMPAAVQFTARSSVSQPAPVSRTPERIRIGLVMLNRPPVRRTVPSWAAPAGEVSLRACRAAARSMAALMTAPSFVPVATRT